MNRLLCNSFALAALALVIAPAAHAQLDITYSVPVYNSPTFTNTLGSGSFTLSGTTRFSTLPPDTAQTLLLDDVAIISNRRPGTNSDPTVTFAETITTSLPLNGVTQDLLFNYTYTPAGPTAGQPNFLLGTPVVFHFAQGSVSVTPLAGSGFRQASFLFTPSTSAVPEPGSLAMLVGLGTTGSIVAVRKRRARK